MKHCIYLLILLLSISACKKDEFNDQTSTPIYEAPEDAVDAEVNGQVLDQYGDYVPDALVEFEGHETYTDQEGIFNFNGQKLFADGTYIQVFKDGYFTGSRKFYASANETSNIKIRLIEKAEIGNIQSAVGGTINADLASVDLPKGSYQYANGDNYNGDVIVYGKWLDPSKVETFDEMPGDLVGLDLQGEEQGLESYGMIVIELTDESGQEVRLPQETKATINMPVPSSLIDNAPSTIPLWHFNETVGIWEEEGFAELIGDVYVGEVSHFSFWNCDEPIRLVNIQGEILVNGQAHSHAQIRIDNLNSGASRVGYTNNNGMFSGKVPLGAPLNISILDQCGMVIERIDIGPFNSDQDMVDFDLVAPNYGNVTLSGNIELCPSYDELPTGVAIIIVGTKYHFAIIKDDGSFDLSSPDCGSNFTGKIYAVDPWNYLSSDTLEVLTDNDQNLGSFVPCNQIGGGQNAFILHNNMPYTPDPSALFSTYSETTDDLGGGVTSYSREYIILDWLTAATLTCIVEFRSDGDTASYIFNLVGFTAQGTMPLVQNQDGDYIFQGVSTDITITDPSIYVGNVDKVFFRLHN